MKLLYSDTGEIHQVATSSRYNHQTRTNDVFTREWDEVALYRLFELEKDDDTKASVRIDVFTDSNTTSTRQTYKLSAVEDRTLGKTVPVINVQQAGGWGYYNPTMSLNYPFYASSQGKIPGADTPQGYEVFGMALRLLHEQYDDISASMPGVFSIQKWWLYDRLPGFKILVDGGVEPEFPAYYPTWWQTLIKQESHSKMLKYLYKADTKAHLKHFSSYIGKPFGSDVAYLCRVLRGHVPAEYVLQLKPGFEVPRWVDAAGTTNIEARRVRRAPNQLLGVEKAFANMTPKRAIRIAQEAISSVDNWHTFLDTIQLLQRRTWPPGTRVTAGVEDFHNQLVAAFNQAGADIEARRAYYAARGNRGYRANNAFEYKAPVAKEIPINEELDGTIQDGYTIVYPKMTTDVQEWGREQRHCLGGYADYAANGTYIILGIYNGSKLVANIGVQKQNKQMLDFRGAANSYVPLDVQKAVLPVLVAHEILQDGIGPHPTYQFQRDMTFLEILTVTQEMDEKAKVLKAALIEQRRIKAEEEKAAKAAEKKKKKESGELELIA